MLRSRYLPLYLIHCCNRKQHNSPKKQGLQSFLEPYKIYCKSVQKNVCQKKRKRKNKEEKKKKKGEKRRKKRKNSSKFFFLTWQPPPTIAVLCWPLLYTIQYTFNRAGLGEARTPTPQWGSMLTFGWKCGCLRKKYSHSVVRNVLRTNHSLGNVVVCTKSIVTQLSGMYCGPTTV